MFVYNVHICTNKNISRFLNNYLYEFIFLCIVDITFRTITFTEKLNKISDKKYFTCLKRMLLPLYIELVILLYITYIL